MRAKWIFAIVLGILLVQTSEADELFPLNDVEINMPLSELVAAHPKLKLAFTKADSTGAVVQCIGYLRVPNNELWDSALFKIAESRLEAYSLLAAEDLEKAKASSVSVLKNLFERLAEPDTTLLVKLLDRDSSYLAPVVVWYEREQFYAFCFTPMSAHKNVELPTLQLTVGSKISGPQLHFHLAEKDDGEKDRILSEVQALFSTLRKR
jgi:hypothetical protein